MMNNGAKRTDSLEKSYLKKHWLAELLAFANYFMSVNIVDIWGNFIHNIIVRRVHYRKHDSSCYLCLITWVIRLRKGRFYSPL